jgi:hypothetical protein
MIDEGFVGGGGLLQSQSGHFQAAASSGDTAVGSSSSTSYITDPGYTTTNDPALTFIVPTGAVNFPDLSPLAASTTTTTFSVINYTSFGYVVQIFGSPPSNGSHTITAMSTLGASQAGNEQFGINLTANISPTTFGAAPDNGTPTFGYGSVTTGYNTANNFKYVSGDTIARASKSSGKTNYTISYIINTTTLTPGGQYSAHQQLICTGTY